MRFFNEQIVAIVREQSLVAEQNGELSTEVLSLIYRDG
jgi:hypothetical protein